MSDNLVLIVYKKMQLVHKNLHGYDIKRSKTSCLK